MKPGLDSIDQRILAELQLDGRQPASALAKKLGISHGLACTRIRRLMDTKTVRVGAYTNSMALGYTTYAVMGLEVGHAELEAVADRLCAFQNVIVVIVGVGWKDILIWSLFRDHAELSDFADSQLGGVPGIKAVETLTVVEAINMWPYIRARWQKRTPDGQQSSDPPNKVRGQAPAPSQRKTRAGSPEVIDEVDLSILSELERDGRQPVFNIARNLGIDRGVASARLKRLLDEEIAKVTAISGPRDAENKLLTMMALRVSPNEIGAVFDKVGDLPGVGWLAKVLGHHNVIMGTALAPADLRNLLQRQLAGIPGVLSVDTMVSLEVKKNAYEYLATWCLERVKNAPPKEEAGRLL